MPYSYPSNLPTWAKNLPAGAKKIAVKTFNAVVKDGGSEDDARQAAWSNIKQEYKQVDDKWVKKTLSVHLDEKIESGGIPDDVLELPGQLPVVWMKIFNGLIDKNTSVPSARHKAWKSVKKYVFQNQNRIWKFKKLAPAEKILARVMDEKVPIKKMQIFSPKAKKDGLFKIFIPFAPDQLVKGVIEDAETGAKFLKGIASANWLDKEDDVIEPSFIKKMHKLAKGLPVFVDHIHDSDHLVGTIVETEGDDSLFCPITELEKEWEPDHPDGNVQVNRLLKRLPKMKLGYSIGGRISKAVKVWRDDLKKFVRHILDGEIYEVSVVPIAALPGSDVSLVIKNLKDSMFADCEEVEENFSKALKSAGLDPEDFNKEHEVDSDAVEVEVDEKYFWMDFDKAVETFSKLAETQPKWDELDEDALPKKCFALTPTPDRKSWKYPYKYMDNATSKDDDGLWVDGKCRIHLEGLDKSFMEAQSNGDLKGLIVLKGMRQILGLGEKSYEFIDFRKLLINTIGDAVDARAARFRLYDVMDEYHCAINQVVWHDEMSVKEKKADIIGLTEQLVDEVSTLADEMAREVVVTVKNFSLK